MISKTDGLYVGVKYSPKTVNKIKQFIIENNIKNPVEIRNIHTTILCSYKQIPSFVPRGKLSKPIIARFKNFDLWKNNNSTKTNLVLLLDCLELINLHNLYTKKYDIQSVLMYNPHITLSYDTDISDVSILPNFDIEFEIIEEYSEELDLQWKG